MPGRNRSPLLTNAAILVVLVAWAVNFLAKVYTPEYEPNTQLDSMLLAVLGFLLAGKVSREPGDAIPDQPTDPPRRDDLRDEPGDDDPKGGEES